MPRDTSEFRPRTMKLSILTAALQELTPRERRDADPDLAIEEWLEFARQIGSPNIELSAALHPSLSDVPAAALLDPVANTLDLREPFNGARAARVRKPRNLFPCMMSTTANGNRSSACITRWLRPRKKPARASPVTSIPSPPSSRKRRSKSANNMAAKAWNTPSSSPTDT